MAADENLRRTQQSIIILCIRALYSLNGLTSVSANMAIAMRTHKLKRVDNKKENETTEHGLKPIAVMISHIQK